MGTPLCILLVDDSEFFLKLETQFLRNTPASILTADSAAKAISLAREHRPSLIFMDIDMPEMDGFAACKALKADRALSSIPVVLIGDQTSPGGEERSKSVGADAFLTKPLDRRHFLGAGHRFLLSIDRREPRNNCEILVDFTCRGRRLSGRCIDVSSGGMFLDCTPTAQKGESLTLKFSLPDENNTPVDIQGRVAWVNSLDEIIKEDFPLGYGVEFIDISESVGADLRRCFGT